MVGSEINVPFQAISGNSTLTDF